MDEPPLWSQLLNYNYNWRPVNFISKVIFEKCKYIYVYLIIVIVMFDLIIFTVFRNTSCLKHVCMHLFEELLRTSAVSHKIVYVFEARLHAFVWGPSFALTWGSKLGITKSDLEIYVFFTFLTLSIKFCLYFQLSSASFFCLLFHLSLRVYKTFGLRLYSSSSLFNKYIFVR